MATVMTPSSRSPCAQDSELVPKKAGPVPAFFVFTRNSASGTDISPDIVPAADGPEWTNLSRSSFFSKLLSWNVLVTGQ